MIDRALRAALTEAGVPVPEDTPDSVPKQMIDQYLRDHTHQSIMDGDAVKDFLLDLRAEV